MRLLPCSRPFVLWLVTAALSLCAPVGAAHAAAGTRLLVAPHATNAQLAQNQPPHLVMLPVRTSDPEPGEPPPLLLWLAGTGGDPSTAPMALLDIALAQGLRVVALSYPTTPAVAQVCTPQRVATFPDCAAKFRQARAIGDQRFGLIDDRQADAIVPRLTQLLLHLADKDGANQWAQYLDRGQPRWARIVLAGQSQGGGMAAYIAKTRTVAGVLDFSGGWDRGPNGRHASWYRWESATPMNRWHATFHVDEPNAPELAQIYAELGIPAAQTHALAEPVSGRSPHGEGIRNPAYAPLWRQMLSAPHR